MPPPAAARRGRARKSQAFHVSVFNCMEQVVPWERDWAELPADAISCVLHKLNLAELLIGGVAGVCRSWRHAAREEPELWRRIDVRSLPRAPEFTWDATRTNMMRSALRLSAGQCQTFSGGGLDDHLFMFLARRAPLLKILHLSGCHDISKVGFATAINKFPLLEELQLVYCLYDEEMLQLVAKLCRCLKHFTLNKGRCHCSYPVKERTDDRKAFAIARMQGLRSLRLVGDNLGNQGLAAIIDNCRHLEYLNLSDCCNITMDGNLAAKCARIIMDYYEYILPSRHCRHPSFSLFSWFSDDDYDPDDYHDLSLYSYLGDRLDGADLDEYERILDVKSMRRYLS